MEHKVKINRIIPEIVDVYHINGNMLGTLNNQDEYYDLAVQLMEKGLESEYYFIWRGKRLELKERGYLTEWPYGDSNMKAIIRIAQAVTDRIKKGYGSNTT